MWSLTCLKPSAAYSAQKISLQFRWFHNYIFAGYYAAKEKGFYDEAGLDVTFIQGSATTSPIDQVINGKAQFGTANSRILIDRFKGKKVMALATIFQHSPLVLITKKDSGIENLHDLVGRNVFFDKSRDVEIAAAFIREGIDLDRLNFVNTTYSIENYFNPDIQAVAAFITNQPWFLIQENVAYNVIQPSTYGIDFYGHCLFTTEDQIRKNPAQVKAFLKASLKGWGYALENPEEMIDLLIEKYGAKESREHIRYTAERVRQLVQPELIEIGHMNRGRWEHMAGTFSELGLIKPGYSLDNFLYDPDPVRDYKWMVTLLVIAIFISFSLIVTALMLASLNRKLREEVKEREKIQKKLAQSEGKFRTAFRTSPHVITLTGLEDGIYTEINDTFTKLLGYSKEEIVGKSSIELNIWNNPKDRDRLIEGIRQSGKVENLEAEFKGRDGQIIKGLMSARILTIEEKKYLMGITQDITGKKETDRAMRLMQYGVDRASDSIFWMDGHGKFTYVNNAAVSMLGYTYEELTSMSLDQIDLGVSIEKWPGRLAWLQRVRYDKFESRHLTKDGRLIPVEVTSSYIDFEGEEGIFSFARDIRERKQAERERLENQKTIAEQKKLALVGKVSGQIAHDFNNILAIIMGQTQLMMLKYDAPDMKKILDLILNQTLRGKNLTKNLVAFARDQEPRQEFFRLGQKIDLVLDLLSKELAGIEINKQEQENIPELMADPGMIEHGIVNLIQNSIHALSKQEKPKISIRIYEKEERVYCEIEDNGCGIPEEYLESIYEPSFTLKGSKDLIGAYKEGIKGSGYGMANVKKYIELHNGQIQVETKPGSGTKFTLSLPVIQKILTPDEKNQVLVEKASFNRKVLLVEDETFLSDIQRRVLSDKPCSHEVDTAGDGQSAINLFNENAYDVVSLDYMLPGKMTGMDVYNYIREKSKTIPVLFISGNIEFLESIKELKKNDPYVDHQSKPCMNIEYLNSINRLLRMV